MARNRRSVPASRFSRACLSNDALIEYEGLDVTLNNDKAVIEFDDLVGLTTGPNTVAGSAVAVDQAKVGADNAEWDISRQVRGVLWHDHRLEGRAAVDEEPEGLELNRRAANG